MSSILPSIAISLLLCACLSGCDKDGGAGATQGCQTSSGAGLRGCVDQSHYREDLEFVAKPRYPGSAHWQAVQDLCTDRFGAAGLTVERQSYGKGVNVIGTYAGAPSPRVIVSAHYDHIKDCPGADDDGTGVAAVLEVARVLALAKWPGTLVVACWDGEEGWMQGSRAYVERLKNAGGKPQVAITLDMIGYRDAAPNSQQIPTGIEAFLPELVARAKANQFRADFIGMVSDEAAATWTKLFITHASAVDLPVYDIQVPDVLKLSPLAGQLRRGDHASFWDADIPAVMLNDTAEFRNPHYHCEGGPDAVSDLDLNFATKVVRATVGAVSQALGLP